MTANTIAASESLALDQALARSALCRAIRWGLEPPHEEGIRRLLSPESAATLLFAAHVLEGDAGRLRDALRSARSHAGRTIRSIREDYERIHGHTLRGRVCPYETEYGERDLFQQSQELADLAGTYRAFGLEHDPAGLRVDHLACEVEFYEFLAQKEAHAIETQDQEMLEVTQEAAGDFLRDHLARFGRAFALSLSKADEQGFYGWIGDFLLAFVLGECERQGVPAGPEMLALRPDDEDGVPMACGSGETSPGLVEIEG